MGTLRSMLVRVGLNGFLLGILLAIGLAAILPEVGSEKSGLPWKPVIHFGIGLVFFLYGLKLNPSQLRSGLSNWKLHLLVHGTTFLMFPLLVFGLLRFFPEIDPNFSLGIRYLAALPSTVSASVVLVSIARGNVAAAIFNASFSSLLGVLLTPLWMQVGSGEGQGQLDLWTAFGDLSFQVFFPVLLGISLHKFVYARVQAFLGQIKYLDQSVILLLVFTTFSESFSQHIFASYSLSSLGVVLACMLGILVLVQGLLYFCASGLGFSREDRITALFCGSTKSLVHGVAIGKVLFPSSALLGLVLLPVMMYHLQQLILGSILARYFEKNKP